MFEDSIEPFRSGDEIRASWLDRVRRAALAAMNIQVDAPLELIRTAGGIVIRLAWNPPFFAKITSGSNPYAWTEQSPAAAGTWTNGARSGTTSVNPLYEQNGGTSVPANTVVIARRALTTGVLIFQRGTC